MFLKLTEFIIAAVMLAQAGGVRPVPPAYSTYVPPASPEVRQRIRELNRQKKSLRGQIEEARALGNQTNVFEQQLTDVQSELQELGVLPDGAPENEIMRAALAVSDEIGRLITQTDDNGISKPVDPERGRALVDYLYRDMGLPDANYRVQMFALAHIQQVAKAPLTPKETRSILRDGLVAYEAGGGGKNSSIMQVELADSLGRVIEPDDAEGFALYQRIASEAIKAERDGGHIQSAEINEQVFKAIEQAIRDRSTAVEFPTEARAAVESLHDLERRRIVDPGQLQQIAGRLTQSFGDAELDDAALRSLLRAYARILRAPPDDVSPAAVAFVEHDLIRIAQLARIKDQLGWRHWKLWAKAAAALGRRASTAMTSFLATEEARLSADPASHKSDKARAVSFARRRLPA